MLLLGVSSVVSDRANAARRVLQSTGVEAKRVVEVRGYADTKPRVLNDPMAPANRRISILLPFTNTPETAPNAEALAKGIQDSLVNTIAQPLRKGY